MSVEDFKKYGQMIAEDEKVRAKAKEIGLNDLPGQVAYAKTLGFEFTREDVASVAKQAGLSSTELSEEQLQKVAGGVGTTTAALAGAMLATVGPIYQQTLITPDVGIAVTVGGERGGW